MDMPPVAQSPENVTGRRIGAALVDVVIFIPVYFVFSWLSGGLETGDGGFQANVTGIPFVLYLLAYLAYFAVFEKIYGGTPGKLLTSLRVVSADGQPLTWTQAIVRTVLRLVDGLPVLYLLGFILVAATANHQRLGDMAARTVVESE